MLSEVLNVWYQISGPSAPTEVQGAYPFVVWNPPQQPNGVITGYRLTFARSGTSHNVTTNDDETFYVIQSTDIPWTSGSFTVTVNNYSICNNHKHAHPLLMCYFSLAACFHS